MIGDLINREIKLRLPGSLYLSLEQRAIEQGVSLEALCLSLLSGQKLEDSLINPDFYASLDLNEMRSELRKVIASDLPRDEMRRRTNRLEFEMSRRYIR